MPGISPKLTCYHMNFVFYVFIRIMQPEIVEKKWFVHLKIIFAFFYYKVQQEQNLWFNDR